MNARLRHLQDGSGGNKSGQICSFKIMQSDGIRSDSGQIYWPFALHLYGLHMRWCVTHLPSGHIVDREMPEATARRLIKQLRALPCDWSFTRPRGRKWLTAKAAAEPVLAKIGLRNK